MSQAQGTEAKPEPVVVAEALGHAVEWDPPAALTEARRWTCSRCGDAVLDYRGNIYGGAANRSCWVTE